MKIYADNAATTRVSDTALAAMTPCFQEIYGNPSSLHTPGQRAAEKLAAARADSLSYLGAAIEGAPLPAEEPEPQAAPRPVRIPGRSPSPPAAARRTTRPSVPRRPWGRSGANVISSQRNSSTMPCSIPSRPWSGRALK